MQREIKILFVIFALSCLLLYSCQEDIIIPKPCNDISNLPFTPLMYFKIVTDTTSESLIHVDKKGYIQGDSIFVRKNGYQKLCKIGGHICSDNIANIYVKYYDTTDNSILKIEASMQNFNWLNIKFLYCPNINNGIYINIGQTSATYSGIRGAGTFWTPLVDGEFRYEPYIPPNSNQGNF